MLSNFFSRSFFTTARNLNLWYFAHYSVRRETCIAHHTDFPRNFQRRFFSPGFCEPRTKNRSFSPLEFLSLSVETSRFFFFFFFPPGIIVCLSATKILARREIRKNKGEKKGGWKREQVQRSCVSLFRGAQWRFSLKHSSQPPAISDSLWINWNRFYSALPPPQSPQLNK